MQVKWCQKLSTKIDVCIGTRQGGISFPFLFNIFYQDLVEKLSKCSGGILVNNDTRHLFVFCYADDLILTSLSVNGLQELIDTDNSYTTEHGLKFNPTKKICTALGCRNFEDTPQWHLNNTILREEAAVTYLGTISSNNTKHHIDTRIKATHRAYLWSTICWSMCKWCISHSISTHA